MARLKGVLPFAALLAEVLIFYRKVLFSSHWGVPWDFRTFHLSLAGFIARSLQRGEFPLWDPYTYSGMPLYANLQAQAYYPPTLITILLSNLAGGERLAEFLEWQVVLHVFLAGAFAYLLLRRLDVSRTAALVGATVFQLGGFFASQAQHLGEMNGAAWLPLAWLAVISLGRGFSWRWLGGLSLALAMAWLAGFPAMSYVAVMSSFLLALVLVVTRYSRWRLLVSTALGCAWAFLLAALQLLPAAELTSLSIAKYRSDFVETGGGVPLQSLVSLVVPNYYNIFDFSKYSAPWNITFMYLYCGIAGLGFVLAALVWKNVRHKTPFALMTLLTLLWMLGDHTPLGKALFVLLPDIVKSAIYAETAMSAFILSMAILAGMGAHRLLSSRPGWLGVAAVVVVAADLILVGSGRPMNAGSLTPDPGFTYTEFGGSSTVLDRVRNLTGRSYPPDRIDLVDDSMNWPTGARYFEAPTAAGNDPLALIRPMQVRQCYTGGERWGRYYVVANADSPVLALVNVRYLLSRGPIESKNFKPVAEFPGEMIFENPGALPRFFLVNRIERAANMEQAIAILRSNQFDPRAVAVVEGDVAFDSAATGAAEGIVKAVDYGNSRMILEVESPQPAFLVSSEVHYPGWRAFVDGVEKPIVMTNAAFRGLPVPAGRHRIEMRFEPAILGRSALVSLAALVLLIVALAFGDNMPRPWISSSN